MTSVDRLGLDLGAQYTHVAKAAREG